MLIARKSFLIFLNIIIASILGYFALFFVLRYMGVEAYGMIGFGMAYVGVFSFISNLGFNQAHIKRVSEGKDLDKCIGTFFMIKLVLILIMVCVVLFSIFFWKVILGRGFETQNHETVVYLFIFYYIILNLAAVPINTFVAKTETAKQSLTALLEPLTRAPLAIIIAYLTWKYGWGSFGILALTGSYIVGVIALLITAMILFRGYPIGKFEFKIFRSYFKFALPVALSSSIGVISVNVDKVMLQLFWTSTVVGYYFGVQRLIVFITLISISITTLLFPTLSERHGMGDYKEIRRLTWAAERYISLIVMPCVILLIVFSKPILNLFSAEVADNASSILRIMAIYSFMICLFKIFANQIIAVDKPRLIAKIGVSMALMNIGLNIIFIPKDIKSLGLPLLGLGAEGAALATTISIAYGLTMCKIFTRRLTGTQWNPRILLHMCSGLVMGGALYYLSTFISIVRWYEVAGASLLGIGIYIAILSLLNEFTKDDLKLFLAIINPKEMKHYIVSELKGKERKR